MLRVQSVILFCQIPTAHIVTLLYSLVGMSFHSSLWRQPPLQNSNGNRLVWSAKYPGWKKDAIFDEFRRLSRNRYEMQPWLL